VFLSGATVGLTTPLIYCPIEYAKLLVQTSKSTSVSSVKVLFDSVGQYGIGRVYRGYIGTILRETPSSGVYYCGYESFLRWKTAGRRDGAQPSDYLLSGSVGGVSYWLVSYPMDVIKTKVQTGSTYVSAVKECIN
jgi:solute carrier family 25 carnitine/acylcarnitine transporter 20/29